MPERPPDTLLNPGRSPLIAGLLTCPLLAAGDALDDPRQCVLAPFKKDTTFNPLTDADPDNQWAVQAVQQGNDGYFTINCELTDVIYPGFMIHIGGATVLAAGTNGNNGYYLVKSVAMVSGQMRVGVQFVPENTASGTLTLIVPHHAVTEGLRRFVNRDTSAQAPTNTFAVIGYLSDLAEYTWLVLGCGANPT